MNNNKKTIVQQMNEKISNGVPLLTLNQAVKTYNVRAVSGVFYNNELGMVKKFNNKYIWIPVAIDKKILVANPEE